MTVSKEDDAGRMFCMTHWKKWNSGRAQEMEMDNTHKALDSVLKSKGKGIETNPVVEEVLNRAIIGEQEPPKLPARLPDNESLTDQKAIQIRFQGGKNLQHGERLGDNDRFHGLDIEFYTPEYTDDHLATLNQAIRRISAVINVLFSQLQKIEQEEDLLKTTETEGTNVVDGAVVEFSHKTKRHANALELKMRTIDTLAKQEARLADLLKQREGLLLNALSLMRKLGIKWSKEAGQMVIAAIEAKTIENMETVEALTYNHTDLVIQPTHGLDGKVIETTVEPVQNPDGRYEDKW